MPKSQNMELSVKHSGKTYTIPVTQETTTQAFKDAISQLTRVPTERMKVMVKGKLVKDDTDYVALANQKQAVMVIGAAEALPPPPTQQIVFLEDVGDEGIKSDEPTGLINLGNTCYLNSTLQAIRAVPEVHQALKEFTPSSSPSSSLPEFRVTNSLKNLFVIIDNTPNAVPPLEVISNLRTLAPQFAERDQRGHYAQQDADEAWTQLVQALRAALPKNGEEGSVVDRLMSIELTKTLKNAETEEEPETTSTETVLKLECNISGTTNFLMSGIQDNLNQQVEKTSATLGRNATYSMQSRISRLPEYLVVHMVRFYWRRDIQKKAKIMRKVKFPLELDLSDIVTEPLRKKIQPLNSATKQILKERDARASILKRKPGQGLDEEKKKRDEEKAMVEGLVKEGGLTNGEGSGMYELTAVVTHKGASADSGHYIGWSRVDDGAYVPAEHQRWAKFDDNNVTFTDANKILSMDGGGEDSVAYILLYRAAKI
ncbi:ubiquitin carboxyl-terminal hydrolase 14 [Cryptococcus neoformans]|uniref:Ubiquitin carboxyl-terminal hydrolase n=2 Tax=Cryptococcus neoformans TaxID=5207 RepID=A0A854Q885_CRYNE|nr:ubiquitin carboxyl-terminal hydrolase 14 [Cryptococcus neoformans var. grubii H99]AUB26239.1 ubiquitin carboxyl-terminal hydrolase 14 [Cryptococcus neoformans var. grubii]OWZ30220.1 ubiquitin carboxyl-terminal hydrolase 14 [Cryptococcus neoformans var. grubii AD2-60a]OWZ38183.1 ubiquitin carboxyl-terminal hydrolase 14 [Cryptococcus neoformans var. grubii AD1-83a]OWZ41939.1 ubiquitin carboxyl-terminal hydrolase 14 [Cryptococcus neoformans var. grubii C23]OWZ52963.1 ubiquitin carboxyl-termina|eukprot:XP_012051032.1 ubiquitin carboxyl-terminal hydrolase 14 [Cryptococcus neoformans var. grubii H99]